MIISKGSKIHLELDDVNEIIFVTQGLYDIGYEINKTERYAVRMKENTQIGGFECSYDKRSHYIYRAFTELNTFFIRKKDWRAFYDSHPGFYRDIRKKFLFKFYLNLKPTIQKHKLKIE